VALRRLSTSSIQTNGKSSKLWDQTTFQSGMFAIATVSLTTASTIVFDNIPSNYSHLQIRMCNLSEVLAGDVRLQFNSDTGSNYALHYLYGNGASATAGGSANTTYSYGSVSGNSSYPGVAIMDVLDYTSTTKNKTVRSLGGVDVNGSGGYVWFASGLWKPTTPVAINKITLFINNYNFNANSHFALYGIKAG
jgi:hypothetical protein